MTTLSTLNIPDDLYVQIQQLASAQNRSVNDEVVRLLQQALQTVKILSGFYYLAFQTGS